MLAAVPNSFASSANEWVIEPSPVPLAERTIFDLQRPLLKVYPPGAHTLRFVFSPMTFFTFVKHVMGLDIRVPLQSTRKCGALWPDVLASVEGAEQVQEKARR